MAITAHPIDVGNVKASMGTSTIPGTSSIPAIYQKDITGVGSKPKTVTPIAGTQVLKPSPTPARKTALPVARQGGVVSSNSGTGKTTVTSVTTGGTSSILKSGPSQVTVAPVAASATPAPSPADATSTDPTTAALLALLAGGGGNTASGETTDPTYAAAPVIPGTQSTSSSGGSSSAVILIVLAAALIAGGYYVYEHYRKKQKADA